MENIKDTVNKHTSYIFNHVNQIKRAVTYLLDESKTFDKRDLELELLKSINRLEIQIRTLQKDIRDKETDR